MSLGLSFYLFSKSRKCGALRRRLLKDNPSQAKALTGSSDHARPDGTLIWFHAADAAQLHAGQELIGRMAEDRSEVAFLITVPIEVEMPPMRDGMALTAPVQFLPEDVPQFVRSFLDHWRPDVVIWSKSPDRPALLLEISNRRIPLFLVGVEADRIQSNRWHPATALQREVLRRFDRILASDQATGHLLERRGILRDRIETCGALQEGSAALPCDEDMRSQMAQSLAARPVWLAAYCSRDEETIVTQAHFNACKIAHRLLLILVPDDPGRGAELAGDLRRSGKNVCLRSAGDTLREETQILVADSHDEMGLWYRLAPVSFMGQSLDGGAGRNPFEPAALGSAVLHGPNIGNYSQSYARLHEAKAAREVRNAAELAGQVKELLAADQAAEMATNAWEVCSRGAEVTDRIIELVFDQIDKPRAA